MRWAERLAKQKSLLEQAKREGKSVYRASPAVEWVPIKKIENKPPSTGNLF